MSLSESQLDELSEQAANISLLDPEARFAQIVLRDCIPEIRRLRGECIQLRAAIAGFLQALERKDAQIEELKNSSK